MRRSRNKGYREEVEGKRKIERTRKKMIER